eukprot:gnl/TRDRNA2_/TRDRNA2_150926_c0_seq2.p1 gnl/TRDRNA2_/TRDRNA2_150926_c0~~gnl/TRDRNA2_/TRDRNA2_150926_c0_seq2.p1  ORF type:complete len:477 (+),score=105.95 gnl/TRDRNA2_/TRDRNA2_150926_c0_seq2:62-1432(+)
MGQAMCAGGCFSFLSRDAAQLPAAQSSTASAENPAAQAGQPSLAESSPPPKTVAESAPSTAPPLETREEEESAAAAEVCRPKTLDEGGRDFGPEDPPAQDLSEELYGEKFLQEEDHADVSFAKDKSIIKFVSEPPPAMLGFMGSDDVVKPTDGARVSCYFAWRQLPASEDDFPDPYARFEGSICPRELSFVLGNCERCDAIEVAVASMQQLETSVFRCGVAAAGDPRCWTDEGVGVLPRPPPNTPAGFGDKYAPVDLVITLLSFESEKDVRDCTPEYRVTYASGRKDAAAKYFKAERFHSALQRYKMVQEVLQYIEDMKYMPDKLKEVETLKRAAKQNEAMCYLKLGDTTEAVRTCNELLVDDPRNEKALYRRASAYLKKGDYSAADADLKRCIEVNPSNQDARKLLQQCRSEVKRTSNKEKKMYSKMLSHTISREAEIMERFQKEVEEAKALAGF